MKILIVSLVALALLIAIAHKPTHRAMTALEVQNSAVSTNAPIQGSW